MIPRLSDIEGEPVVGETYLVPCVKIYDGWVAVIGPWHEDANLIGFPKYHYHQDVRFLTAERLVSLGDREVSVSLEEYAMIRVITTESILERPMLRRRRMPDFPLVVRKEPLPWFRKLEEEYKDVRLKSCLTCPHRGMKLANLPRDEEGNVVCNGHGLKWNLETGQMVRRVATNVN